MKTILVPSYNRQRTLRNLAKENGGKLTDVKVLSFSSALHEQSDDSASVLLSIQQQLLSHKEEFSIYGDMFQYPAFLNEMISFAKECILYDISVEQLPEDNPNNMELKQLLSYVLNYPFLEKEFKKNAQKEVDELKKSDVEIRPFFLPDAFHYRLLEELKKEKPYQKEDHSPIASLKTSLNRRQEIETIAQDIIQNGVTANVILCDPENQYPVVEQVFSRYNIPFSTTCGTRGVQSSIIYRALVEFGIYQDVEHFLKAISCNAFSVPCPDGVYSFLCQTYDGSEFHHLLSQDVPSQKKKIIEGLEKARDNWLTKIEEEHHALLQCTSAQDVLICAYNLLRNHPLVKDSKEQTAALSIRTSLNSCLTYVKTKQDALTIVESLYSSSISFTSDVTDFCTVTDLRKPIPSATNSYVVGCSGASYPGYKAKSGLFDETYVKKISNYPSSEERYNMYMDQLSWISSSAKDQLIYSCSSNDYQGRDITPAFQVEQIVGDNQSYWKPLALKPKEEPVHSLDTSLTKALFEENGVVLGSISRVERYFVCPYSYFIQSGLHIREPQTLGLDAASIGTIQHSVFEQGVTKYGKQINQMSDEEILKIISPSFTAMNEIEPFEKEKHQLTKERMLMVIRKAIDFLADYESVNFFEPKEMEYKFVYPMTDHVTLRGTIDRLDIHNDDVRILDYKSSDKSLNEKKVKAGEQLQLLSYLIVACEEFKKKAAGAYYFSLKDNQVKDKATNVKTKDIEDTHYGTLEEEAKAAIKAKSLSGWTFTENDYSLGIDSIHILKPKYRYDYSLVEKCIRELYKAFYDGLMAGVIPVEPIEGACTFCKYKPVCHFHGELLKPQPVVMKDASIRIEKKDKKGAKKK